MHARIGVLVLILDTVFLAEFTVVGVVRGFAADLPFLSCVFIGVLTGVGGGILRDLLLHRSPVVLNPGKLEALAALIGAVLQTASAYLIGPLWSMPVGFGVVVIVRLLSSFLGWETRAAGIARAPDSL